MYMDTTVPLIKLSEDDFELLEADQLTLQGMVASRYTHFKDESSKWQKWLVTVSEVNQVLSDIQRMWSYLEPLFIGSDEVKKELKEDAKRFEGIDAQVRQILKRCFELKNVKKACTQSGLLSKVSERSERAFEEDEHTRDGSREMDADGSLSCRIRLTAVLAK